MIFKAFLQHMHINEKPIMLDDEKVTTNWK